MNILIPDSWLREFLETKATPHQIKEYLSLCGPSVERINKVGNEIIYDIEVTSNRPDSMSVFGIAREAAAILPRFGIAAKLTQDPYQNKSKKTFRGPKKLHIKTDPTLNPRWTSVIIDNVTIGPSPHWLKQKLEATGIRSLNTIVDITNYLMRAYGQPAHAFDYDAIEGHTMILRASNKGEKITTLDGKTHTLPGGDIVIEDGTGQLIDLCGIMGAENSAIKKSTKTIVLFMQTYNPATIRKTVMTLAHRTEAASLFEKGLDPELVYPTVTRGIELVEKIAGGKVASNIYDIYHHPDTSRRVSVSREKLDRYLGTKLSDKEIRNILEPLGFSVTGSDPVTVRVPSFRRDVTLDVDIIEEVARMYGYHNIKTKLPEGEPPVVAPDTSLMWEEEIKTRLRDWGYTELYTYSMISDDLMDIFKLDKKKAYKIANPLSSEWVYMRPSLLPSVLQSIKQNLNIKENLKLFELSMMYEYRPDDLPNEKPILLVAWTGNKFYEAKGLAEALFSLMGIPFHLEKYGSVMVLPQKLLSEFYIGVPVTILELDFGRMASDAKSKKTFHPIPKYPASFEDLAFIVPPQTHVGPMIEALKNVHPLVADVTILDSFENIRTFHITYQSKSKNLTAADLRPVREKLISTAEKKFSARLKTQ